MNSNVPIAVERRDGILRIMMNRPDKKNALTIDMYKAMTSALRQADSDSAVRVILIHGAGGCFTSGNDLKDFLDFPPTDESSPVFEFMAAISRAEKPVVAAVSGLAVGIGTTMLLHCDLVYAGKSAKFLLPFVNLGLCPEAGSSYMLPLLAGYQRAAELLLLGEAFSADLAKEIGLANAVCDDDAVFDMALAQAQKLAAKPQPSVRLTKALLKKSRVQIIDQAIAEESQHLLKRLKSPEAAEAFAAFFERRQPDFTKFS